MENNRKTFNARAAVFLLVPLALAGCGKGSASNAPVAATERTADGDPGTLAPGRWELTATTESDIERPFGSAPSTSPTPQNAPCGGQQTRTTAVCVTPISPRDPARC